jgi:hypothetical protein
VITCSSSIVLLLTSFRTHETYFKFDPISPLEIITEKILRTYERLAYTNDMNRSTNAHKQTRCNTLKPTWQDFSAVSFDVCGFTGVMIVVLNTKFELASFCTSIFAFCFIAVVFNVFCSVTLTFTLKMNRK